MADASFQPIRRYKISFLPASVSKYHTFPVFTNGIGYGQFLSPKYRVTVPSGSFTKRFISSYLCTKCARDLVSSSASPEFTISFPSGPNSSSSAFSSLPCAAAYSALQASSGDENVFWPCCWPREPVAQKPATNTVIAANFQIFALP